MTDNRLTGIIPSSISNSSNLEYLQLAINNFYGQVPSLQNLRNLKRLMLTGNRLGYGHTTDLDFVHSMSNSTMLDSFWIANNSFSGTFPHTLCNFTRLRMFSIAGNKISGSIPPCITNLKNLVRVLASKCLLSGNIPSNIGELKNLRILDLHNNQLSGQLPSSIGNLTQVISILLSGNNLQGPIPSTIGNCKNLEELYLSYNHFSGRIPSQIFSIPRLSVALSLSHNQLTGPLPIEIGKLTNLEALYISDMLSGEIPESLSACVSLEFLYMGGNSFQGVIPSSLSTLMGLQQLNLSHNSLSGNIPDFLAKFRLQKLDLSDNKLEGMVPVGGIFRNATAVSLSGNKGLCGGIPALKLPQCNSRKTPKTRLSHKVRLVIATLTTLSAIVILLVAFVALYVSYCKKRTKGLQILDASDWRNTLSHLSYHSILKATNEFASENLLGSGTFGVVYKGTLDEDPTTMVAIKKFNLEHKGASKSFMAECEVLRSVRHRNLLKVITACSGIDYQGNDFKALVYEYMPNGSLEDWLHPQQYGDAEEGTSFAPKYLDLCQRIDIAVDVSVALEYLHHGFGASIVHCDLKPSNVLLDHEMVAHVGDFGLAKFLSKAISTSSEIQSTSAGIRGTIGYTPPEYGMGNEVSNYGDIYSFGILILEMFTGKRPTDEMFREGLSLHNFVKAALPDRVIEILDNALIQEMVGEETITSEINPEARCSKAILEALVAVLEIGVCCSVQLPNERLDIKYVVTKLSSIRNKIIGTRQR